MDPFAPRFTPTPLTDRLLDLALAEDLGCGDVTSRATIPAEAAGQAIIEARQDLVVCGIPVVDRLLRRHDPATPPIEWCCRDGVSARGGAVLGRWSAPLRTLLVLERIALNILQRMSGVATTTRRYVDAVEGTGARVVDTRKTLPGWRALDKYAVRAGGGHNHRMALDGGVLIKDNHLKAAGGIAGAVRSARLRAPHSLVIEVEVEDLDGLQAALDAGAQVVLLDNFTPEQVARAVEIGRGRALLEASGGVDLASVRAYAAAGVDLIAIGALTHSAPAADLAMEVIGGEAGG